MALGYDRPLYMLAFDHRGSFRKDLFGIRGTPSPAEHERISDSKRVIYEGFERAVTDGVSPDAGGVLVDEEYGVDVARKARLRGFKLAMPVEKSGQPEFDFEFGDEFGEHIEEFDPAFAKVLVRYNPDGDRDLNERQTERLRELSHWLHERDRRFLFELLVPAEPAQLEAVAGDVGIYDRELRPALVVTTIRQMQDAGVEADIWKIEGLDRRDDCERVAAQARSGGRERVACIVLGRGASVEAVARWLRNGAGVPGYIGFAVGRTLWWAELSEYVAGKLEREAAAERIADNYRRMVDVYTGAEQHATSAPLPG
jgi:myo-inositol catabolism protein IolC